jgi:hypothetical protein
LVELAWEVLLLLLLLLLLLKLNGSQWQQRSQQPACY